MFFLKPADVRSWTGRRDLQPTGRSVLTEIRKERNGGISLYTGIFAAGSRTGPEPEVIDLQTTSFASGLLLHAWFRPGTYDISPFTASAAMYRISRIPFPSSSVTRK